MILTKLARDVHSSELTDSEKEKLRGLWSLPCYELTLEGGLLLRDACLHSARARDVIASCLTTMQWASNSLPTLLFPTH